MKVSKKLILALLLGLHFSALFAQESFKPFFGVAYHMDAEAFYGGVTVQGGVSRKIKKTNFQLMALYFGAKAEDIDYDQKAFLRMGSVGVAAERFLFKRRLKQLYAGLGVLGQYRYENFKDVYDAFEDNRLSITGLYKIGYMFGDKKANGPKVSIELLATGPYMDSYFYELFTQIGIGLKIGF